MSEAWLAYANAFPGMRETLGMRITEADDQHVLAEMRATEASALPNGFYFGGALLALADWVAGALTAYQAVPPDELTSPTTMPQLNVNILRNSQSPLVRGEARWLRHGRSVMVVETRITDEDGRLMLHATSSHVPVG